MIGRFRSFGVVVATLVTKFCHPTSTSLVMALSASSMPTPVPRPPTPTTTPNAPVILVIGACALDRLLTVSEYPHADAKIRTTSYDEAGGGNAANTASAIGKLCDAQLFSNQPPTPGVRVELLTKVGDDAVGQQIIDDLTASNVGTSSSLFRKGTVGSTTAFTTVIVDSTQQTRTCIHTPGSCGELSLEDVQSLSPQQLDRLFRNVIHLHSDSRHTDAALWLAKEAKQRNNNITISCDCEKDRSTTALDELIDVCDTLFTNSNHIGAYLERLTREHEASTKCQPLPTPTISVTTNKKNQSPSSTTTTALAASPEDDNDAQQLLIETYVRSLAPSIYFARWQETSSIGKEVVVTHGSMGALHYKQIESSKAASSSSSSGDSKNTIELEIETDDDNDDDSTTAMVRIRHSFDDGTKISNHLYQVHTVGILKDAPVVDTTGAGDAFIGGYILVSNTHPDNEKETSTSTSTSSIGNSNDKVKFALQVGSFVGGRKVGGPGARSALPTGRQFDGLVGSRAADAKTSLQNMIGAFHR